MGMIRASVRSVAFVLLLLFWGAGLALGNVLRRGKNWRNYCMKIWARSTAAACGIRIIQKGQPPPPPYFMVFNHLSYVDALLLYSTLDHAMACVRHDFAEWPGIGTIARQAGAIWVRRSDFTTMPDVTRQIRERIAEGYGVLLAPEATTTRGDKVYPFHSTLLAPAAELNLPAHYCVLRFETQQGDPPAWKVVNWWEESTFTSHAWRLLHCRSITATIIFAEQPILDSNRKQLAKKLQDAVTQIYIPM